MEALLLNLFVMLGLAENADALEFTQAGWLWLILLWPLFWFVSGFTKDKYDDISESQAQTKLRVKHPLIHLVDRAKFINRVSKVSLSYLLLQFLRGVILLLLAIVLANPVERLPASPQAETKTVRDIAFVIESSASFLLPDYELNGTNETRMNVVKQVLDQFIAELSGNRFSVTIYAEQAFTLLPMTYDATLARLTLKRLKPYLAGRTDMAIGEALGLALKQTDMQLQNNSFTASSTNELNTNQQRKKIMVLISDGLSLPSRLALTEAVNYSQLLQVPIYTIGVGASSQKADNREFTGLLYQPLEAESLQRIAQQTGGQYFRVGSGQEIKQVLEKINQVEGVPFTPPAVEPKTRILMFYPLSGLLLIFFFYGLSLIFIRPSVGADNV